MISKMSPPGRVELVQAINNAKTHLHPFSQFNQANSVSYHLNGMLELAALLHTRHSIYARVIKYQRIYCKPSPSSVRAHHEDLRCIEVLNRSIEYYESRLYITDFKKAFVRAIESFLSFIDRNHDIAEIGQRYAILAQFGMSMNMLEALELTNVVETFILANASTDVPAIEALQRLPSR